MNISNFLPNLNNLFQNQNIAQNSQNGPNGNYTNSANSSNLQNQNAYNEIYNLYPKNNIDDKPKKYSNQNNFNQQNSNYNTGQINNGSQNNIFQNLGSIQNIGELLSMFTNKSSGGTNPLISLLGNFLGSNKTDIQNFMLDKTKEKNKSSQQNDCCDSKKISDYIIVETDE